MINGCYVSIISSPNIAYIATEAMQWCKLEVIQNRVVPST